jgi:DNA-directed RNA polymerase specialized sigma24 family protein
MLHSPQQAEEVYVETFLRVARDRVEWQQRGTVRGYLFTIAHRLCLDILRQRRVMREAVPHLVQFAALQATMRVRIRAGEPLHGM